MSWHDLVGHDEIVENFRRTLQRDRLATSYLLTGPAGVGKCTFALGLAQSLLCQNTEPAKLKPCGKCDSCLQVEAGSHPDITIVARPEGKKDIPVELLIGDREHRGREGFCHDLSLKPFMGGRKIGIIDDADCLNQEGSNCLLKTLEEPPPRSVLFLIGTNPDAQLPTIRSRCQIIHFQPLAAEQLVELLISGDHVKERAMAERMASQSDGGMTSALDWADDELWQFRDQLVGQLSKPSLDRVRVSQAVQKFVDDAGKAHADRRQRAGRVMQIAEQYYRQRLRDLLRENAPADDAVQCAVASIDRCLAAHQHIDRNANMATLISCWVDDLG
ncbi:MAG: DNA polymerase III subunit delta' [Planctomycetales bacterium]